MFYRLTIVLFALELASCAVPPAPEPLEVTFYRGGIMSTPYGVSVDLATGKITDATPAGDGQPLAPQNRPPPEQQVPPDKLAALRALAGRVWADGSQTAGCMPQADAVGGLDIKSEVRNKTEGFFDTRSYMFSMTCQTPDAKALITAINCAAYPKQGDCRT